MVAGALVVYTLQSYVVIPAAHWPLTGVDHRLRTRSSARDRLNWHVWVAQGGALWRRLTVGSEYGSPQFAWLGLLRLKCGATWGKYWIMQGYPGKRLRFTNIGRDAQPGATFGLVEQVDKFWGAGLLASSLFFILD